MYKCPDCGAKYSKSTWMRYKSKYGYIRCPSCGTKLHIDDLKPAKKDR
ncbi:MAG: hypothetical protein ACOCZ5_01055 [bacterium]